MSQNNSDIWDMFTISLLDYQNLFFIALFSISCPKNHLFRFLSELHSYQKIIFARSRSISGIVNNSDFKDTDPIYYFTSLLKNVSYRVLLLSVTFGLRIVMDVRTDHTFKASEGKKGTKITVQGL